MAAPVILRYFLTRTYIATYVTGFAKTLHLYTSNFTTLVNHNFKSKKGIALKFLYVINQC